MESLKEDGNILKNKLIDLSTKNRKMNGILPVKLESELSKKDGLKLSL